MTLPYSRRKGLLGSVSKVIKKKTKKKKTHPLGVPADRCGPHGQNPEIICDLFFCPSSR